MQVKSPLDLSDLNTFRVKATAQWGVMLNNLSDVKQLSQEQGLLAHPVHILAGGSNSLFLDDWPGVVILPNLQSKQVLEETDQGVVVEVESGHNWHQLVMWAVEQGLSGIENLAYIPGKVGGAVVQNIAAYGQVMEDVLQSVLVMHLPSGELQRWPADKLALGYRTSIFKQPAGQGYLIVSARLQLSKQPRFDLHYHSRYESLADWLKRYRQPPYSPQDVAEAVISLRKHKLPEVEKIPNCGSFFVNPIVSVEKFHQLSAEIDQLQHYPVEKMKYDRQDWQDTSGEQFVKIPAGRLLDELGWKGKWIGNVGTYHKHSLIVITNGKASGQEIWQFGQAMKQSVKQAFGIELQSEICEIHPPK